MLVQADSTRRPVAEGHEKNNTTFRCNDDRDAWSKRQDFFLEYHNRCQANSIP
jgi:hypothetical protein